MDSCPGGHPRGLAAFTLVKATDVEAEPASSANVLTVEVDAHQFYWLYRYPNGAVSLDTLYLPVDRPVALELNAADVNHSWWVPELTGKRDAIPGRTNVLNFEPRTIGTYEGQCAEHCGVQHAVMRTTVEVLSAQEFDRWLDENAPDAVDPVELGRQEWEAVCAKCHLSDGKRPGRADRRGQRTMLELDILRNLLLNGQNQPGIDGYMPAVGTAGRTSSSRRSSSTSSRTSSSRRRPASREERAPVAARPATARAPTWKQGSVTQWLVTLDHKRIGVLYIVSAFFFFFAGGIMALLMRIQLGQAEQEIVTRDGYNQLFTIHGTTMIFLFVVPILAGFGNYIVPLMIGAPDMAFPRLNALSYWLFLLGGLVVIASFWVDGGAASSAGRPIRRSRARTTARPSDRTSGSSGST